MIGGFRLFLWRRQRGVAIAYLTLLALAWALFLGFTFLAPRNVDIGATVLARSIAYHATFEEVERARTELEQGKLEAARLRLQRFVDEHATVQNSQLETHAVVEAHELLADIHMRQHRPRRAVRLLESLTDRLPLDYRAWYLRGMAEKRGVGLVEAAQSLRQAFLISLPHHEVTEEYLSVLADLTALEEILWVADQFWRGARRARPMVSVKVGTPRSALDRRLMSMAGIPVEQGRFIRWFDRRGLPRGNARTIACPPELLADWPDSSGRLTIQLRFEHIHEGLRIDALRCVSGASVREIPIAPEDLRILHRKHSSREYSIEFDIDLDPRTFERLEIVYSCPELTLHADALAIIEKARANLRPRGG